jgi:hypothetical protein
MTVGLYYARGMTTRTQDLKNALQNSNFSLKKVAEIIESSGPEERIELIRTIKKKGQHLLWDAADGNPVDLEHLVPATAGSGVEVIHSGKNSLPMFTHFEKRFCRTEDGQFLYGYNEGALRWLIGPGCFVAEHFDDFETIGVNYYKVPPKDAALPEDWPSVRPNEKGISNFVYAKMVDYLRKVSDHVAIGRAWKKGKQTSNFFILVRNDP